MDRAALRARLEAAEDAWRDLDNAAFTERRDALQRDLPCLTEVLLPRDAAWVHQIEAMQSYLLMNSGVGDPQARAQEVKQSWRAALSAEPSLSVSAEIAPPGVPLRDLLDEARLQGGGAAAQLPRLSGAGLSVNGALSETLPAEHPNLVQWLDDSAEVQATAYLAAGAGLPELWELPLAGEAPGSGGEAPPRSQAAGRTGLQRWGMLATAGVVGLGAGGLYLGHALVAVDQNACVDGSVTCTSTETEALTDRADALWAASIATGGVAVGLGVLGLVIAF